MSVPKGIVIILDGIGDRPISKLGGKTPLAAAHTPHLDALVKRGVCGLMHPLQPWVPVGTQVGMGLLLGVPPADLPRLTRGPIEAAGVGIKLQSGDVALRCNFATITPSEAGFAIVDRRAGRIQADLSALSESLDGMGLSDGVTASFKRSTGHRAVLILHGNELSGDITDTDPGAGAFQEVLQSCKPLDAANQNARRTAHAVNTFIRESYERLSTHPVNAARQKEGKLPANGIMTRGAGQAVSLRNQLVHLGLKVAVVTGERTAVGLGQLFGFSVLTDASFTALPTTNLEGKVQRVQEALETHDVVYLHIKAPDVLAHDQDPVGKMKMLEAVDRALEPLLGLEHVILVTGDHSSDSSLGRHVGDPVPSCLAAPHLRTDTVEVFSEEACLNGGLGHLSATHLLCALLDHMNRLPNYRPQHYVLF